MSLVRCFDQRGNNLVSSISHWELKLGEYAAITKLTVHVHNKSLTKFKQE